LVDENWNACIGDFGVAAITENSDTVWGTEGTYAFIAPETLEAKGNQTEKQKGYSG